MLTNLRVIETHARRWAPWLLGLSVLVHFALVATNTQMTMIDLLVYRGASPSLLHGNLYDWRQTQFTAQFALPFTYPPFAALVFLPLSWVPWVVVKFGWQLVSVVCLWWLVRLSLRLVARDRAASVTFDEDVWRRRAMLWTAVALWFEPVRTTVNYGQINLLLAGIVLAGMVSARPVLSGLSVGVTAGIKLTPALSGIYFLATKRWAAAIWSFVAFAATVGLAYAVSPAQSTLYWFHLINDPTRIGPIASAINQSLRGALSRTVGHDVGMGPLWIAAAVVAVALLIYALRAAVRAGDVLAGVLCVQFFTLLVSPISWSHHWVWMVPALLWLLYGRVAGQRAALWTATMWLVAVGSYLISFLLAIQPSIWTIPHPWWAALLGWVYPVCGMVTLIVIGALLGKRRAPAEMPVATPAAVR
ncbi:MAG TPA: mannosyltransferase [Pseudonocardiaceae bacterium]|nr:mannosyltransferase [Pseudonocardiaceae bacterium]